jgi:hypothetical protein
MSEGARIALTAGVTVFGGLLVYTAGQLLSRFFIDPWYEQRKVIGSITEALLTYAPLFAGAGPSSGEANDAALRLRQLSDSLMARTVAVPCYGVLAGLRLARPIGEIREASRGLVRLSNTLTGTDWRQKMLDASRVAVNLRIDAADPGSLSKDFAEQLQKQA